MTLEQYLIDVGIRACDYESMTEEKRQLITDNVEYFKLCYNNDLSAYKALLFFQDYLNGDYSFNL